MLQTQGWLQTLSRELQLEILKRGSVRMYHTGEVVWSPGHDDVLFGVFEGAISVYGVTASEADASRLVQLVWPGAWFVVAPSLFESPPLRALAAERTGLFVIQGERLRDLVERVSGEPLFLAGLLADQATTAVRIFAEAHLADPSKRIAYRILRTLPSVRSSDSVPVLPLSQEELGHAVGLSRKVVGAVLADLERQGFIQRGRKRIHVLDPIGLQARAAVK